MVQQGSQLSEWTECLRPPTVLWQWPQGLQLSEWTEGLRTPAMLWQWPQALQLSEWTWFEDPFYALAMAARFTTI